MKSKIAVFAILVFFLNCSLAQLFEDPLLVKPIDTFEEIESIRSGKSDNLNCIFYHTKKCPKCEQAAPVIEKLAKNYLDIVNVYDVNCHTLWRELEADERKQVPICDPANKDKMPQIIFFQVPTRKINPYTNQPMKAMETPYQGEASAFALSDFAATMIPSFRTFLNNKKELNNFLRYKKIPNKVLLFTERDDTPISFRGLTSMYRDRLDFGEVRKNSKELIEQYEIQKFPTLLVLKLNAQRQYEKEYYTGDYKFDKIKEWLESYALENKVNREDSSSKDDEDSIENESSIPDLKPKDFEKLVLGQEKMVLIHVFKSEEASSFNEIRKKFGSMIEYYDLKCIVPSNEKFAKETLEVKKFPSLRFYPPGVKKSNYKYNFEGDIELKDFQKEVSELTDDDSTPLNQKDLQMFLSSAFQEEKIPVILFHQTRETFISFRTFTLMSKYTSKFKFFSFRDPSPKMLKDFGINEIPKLAALIKSNEEKPGVQIAQYTGRFNYGDMLKFFDSLGKVESEGNVNQRNSKRMRQINNQDEFEKLCMKTSFCFIGFFDSENKESEVFQNKLETLEIVKDKYSNRPVTFVWIDGICHHYLLSRVNVQEEILPQLVAYNPSKNQYVNQIGTFEVDSLTNFVDKVLKGKVETHNLKEDLDIDETNCKDVYDARERKRKELENMRSAEDDEILKEILEEERIKKEKFKAELKEQKKTKKKKGSKKTDL